MGRDVDGALMRKVCDILGIDKLRTTAYKPSTNAAIERFHRTLNAMLAKAIASDQRNWDTALPYVLAAYRSSKHEATGFSPNMLMMGREARTPMDIVYGMPEAEVVNSYDDYADEMTERMKFAYAEVRRNTGQAALCNKKRYDMRVKPCLLYTSPSPRDGLLSRMPSSA